MMLKSNVSQYVSFLLSHEFILISEFLSHFTIHVIMDSENVPLIKSG